MVPGLLWVHMGIYTQPHEDNSRKYTNLVLDT